MTLRQLNLEGSCATIYVEMCLLICRCAVSFHCFATQRASQRLKHLVQFDLSVDPTEASNAKNQIAFGLCLRLIGSYSRVTSIDYLRTDS